MTKKNAAKHDYDGIEFLMQEKDFRKIKVKTIYLLMCLVTKIGWFFQFIFQIKNLKTQQICCFYLVIMMNHIMCISEILKDLCFTKQKKPTKNGFCRSFLQCFSRESVLIKRKGNCLIINGKQSVIVEEGIIEFKNYYKQIPVLCKTYADFECNFRGVEFYEGSYKKNIKITFLAVLLIKSFVLMTGLLREMLFIEVKMLLMNLLKQFLRSINIAKK